MYYDRLKDTVKDKIARGERPDDLQKMTIMAVRINNCLYKQHKEKGHTSHGNNKNATAYTSGQKRRNWHQKNDKYGPKPMEIDIITPKKKKTFDGECYNCSKKGHLVQDCQHPQRTRNQDDSKVRRKQSMPKSPGSDATTMTAIFTEVIRKEWDGTQRNLGKLQ